MIPPSLSVFPPRPRRRVRAALALLALLALPSAGSARAAAIDLPDVWPAPEAVGAIEGERITFPSHSPYTIADVGDPEDDPATTAMGTLFMPAGASAESPVPAVVMLHGAAGVGHARELTYGRQFAAMGIAALAVDVFAARRDRAAGFTERLIEITEAMFLADAYAALRHLAAMPAVDGARVALMGFSYGGMASRYAAYAQVAEAYAPEGLRFAGHISFYAPCIANFEDNRATGAPLLMLIGARDGIVDRERCRTIAAALEAGGAPVEVVVYADGYHQWDGGYSHPRHIGRDLSGCRLSVEPDGVVRDEATWLPMTGTLTRKLILGLCSGSEGYTLLREDEIRARSNEAVGRFLTRVFNGG